MDDTIRWLQGRPYYEGQITERRTTTGREATFADVDLDSRLASAFESEGIDRLYDHQAAAVSAVRDGDNVVLATPTASGKSVGYTVPAFERALDDRATTLYIAPQVALINDQEETLSDLAHGLGFASGVSVAQYTGRQDRKEKEAIRDRQPTVLLTTPDMLHYGIMPHGHRLWDWFFERLETVVIDEVHEYRGVFGSHVSLVFRRLARLCERFDADPDWVCCSATTGNPVDHAATVTGQPTESFDLVTEDTSATGPTHWLCWNPPEYGDGEGFGSGRRRSNHVETKRLFVDLVTKGHQTVVFTQSRQVAERYATDSASDLRDRGEHDIARSVEAYQAALTDERRGEIEDGLDSGEIRGVWSTNALELGVDIGGLDAVLLDGYPGTRMAAFQQGGRAGRGTDPSLVAMVAGEDQLDQYLMAHPRDFFDEEPEEAISNPENEHLMPDHVLAGARETWLQPDDDDHFGGPFPDIVADLTESGDLDRRNTDAGLRWLYSGEGSPQHEMSLRTVGDREVQLRDRRDGDRIAKLSFADALRDAHPGAVYHHQGQDYEVVDLDLRSDVADLAPVRPDYYTQVLHDKTITVENDRREQVLPTHDDVTVRFADVSMRKQITGFERYDRQSGEPIGQEPLELPETTLETEALYFTVPEAVETDVRVAGDGPDAFPGAIHAAEHGMISLFPLSFLCDRRDVGGLSTPLHPHTDCATIFVYDGYPGGVGLTERAYETVVDLMERTLGMLRDCPCESGCPACVQSPHCGNANDPLEKDLAADLLGALVE
ncbi:ATP-dependent helicase [Halosimplex carlsbadense 2-9-1]|uniref:ATP-dependent helicase n=1 Tax=Halosimplex carlsbadense 2-9-1 TaxID=797114 RepID=M0CJE2_9EURY|nr:DEAD/DEAH box helicase [Halosimplex carlsbadense]ELZ22753.1 ATP-dependent helicase [Halosimplex carlsbadense 2-9-1]